MAKEKKQDVFSGVNPAQVDFFTQLTRIAILSPWIAQAMAGKCDCDLCRRLRELGSKYEKALKEIKEF